MFTQKVQKKFGDIEACRNEGVNIKFDLNPLFCKSFLFWFDIDVTPSTIIVASMQTETAISPLSLVVRDAVY